MESTIAIGGKGEPAIVTGGIGEPATGIGITGGERKVPPPALVTQGPRRRGERRVSPLGLATQSMWDSPTVLAIHPLPHSAFSAGDTGACSRCCASRDSLQQMVV